MLFLAIALSSCEKEQEEISTLKMQKSIENIEDLNLQDFVDFDINEFIEHPSAKEYLLFLDHFFITISENEFIMVNEQNYFVAFTDVYYELENQSAHIFEEISNTFPSFRCVEDVIQCELFKKAEELCFGKKKDRKGLESYVRSQMAACFAGWITLDQMKENCNVMIDEFNRKYNGDYPNV